MDGCDKLISTGRRAFFVRTAAAAAGAAASVALPARADTKSHQAQALALVVYPLSRLANLNDLKVDTPLVIAYPDDDSPGVLLKLGHAVEGGAGPDGDLVAFSTLCPHKGFPLFWLADDRSLNCPGHYSRFDVEKGRAADFRPSHAEPAAVSPASSRPSGDIYAVSVDELIYGRLSNVLQGLRRRAMAFKRNIDRLPIPPKDAKVQNAVCHYCIVGCGYHAISWPVDRQGGMRPDQNLFGPT